ncbi:acyl-CoA dehydrogenase family protein [Pseudarthrobacter sp. NPDC058329]|uniref:acyl-CoA dehydrogenase family protein n=1 Tax=Pseudarthrobacter sp. NPDC058329 TaxID=3346448 RepID=UPI0036DB6D2B
MTQLAAHEAQQTMEDLRTKVRALAEDWFRESGTRPLMDPWLRGFEPEFSKRLSSEGLIGITWPAEYGGGGRSNAARLAVTEELLRAGAPSAAHWISERQIGPAILRHGSAALKEEILPGIVSVDNIFCLGMSEEHAGSDLAAVRTRAEKVDGGWLLTGRKMWTGYAHKATHAYVLARTSDGVRKHEGLSEFIVDMGEGVSVTPILNMAGEHRFNQVDFRDVFVPDIRLLGAEGNGWRQVVEQLSFERGGAERYLSSYLLFTELLRRLRKTGIGLQEMVGSLVQRLTVLRHLAFLTAEALDRGEAPIRQAAALKLLGNQFEVDILESFRKTLRPEDLARTSNYSIGVQSAPGFELRGGSVEVLLSIIAKEEARP